MYDFPFRVHSLPRGERSNTESNREVIDGYPDLSRNAA